MTVYVYDPYGNVAEGTTIDIMVFEPVPADFPLGPLIILAAVAGVAVVVIVVYLKKKS